MGEFASPDPWVSLRPLVWGKLWVTDKSSQMLRTTTQESYLRNVEAQISGSSSPSKWVQLPAGPQASGLKAGEPSGGVLLCIPLPPA